MDKSCFKVIVRVTRGYHNPAACYDGDMSVSVSVGTRRFSGCPLNEAFTELLIDFARECNKALNAYAPVATGARSDSGTASIVGVLSRYLQFGMVLHDHARKTICSDVDRETVALQFANNYMLSAWEIARGVLGDAWNSPDEGSVQPYMVEIDRFVAGIVHFDGGGMLWPLEVSNCFHKIPRVDLSRGIGNRASVPSGPSQSDRVAQLVDFLHTSADGLLSSRKKPTRYWMAIGDAFRATPQSVQLATHAAVNELKERVRGNTPSMV